MHSVVWMLVATGAGESEWRRSTGGRRSRPHGGSGSGCGGQCTKSPGQAVGPVWTVGADRQRICQLSAPRCARPFRFRLGTGAVPCPAISH